jgi:tetratricopeptide (TPR) repeat protein
MAWQVVRPVRIACLMLIALSPLLDVAPIQAQVSIERARSLVSERRDAEETQKLLRAILAQNPRQAEANYLLASVLYTFRRYDEAVPYAEQAAALSPRDSRARLLMGKTCAARIQKAGLLGKVDLLRKARAEFEAAVAADPRDIASRRALAGLLAEAPSMLGGSMDEAVKQVAEIERIDAAEGHLMRADLYGMRKKPREIEPECRRAVEAAGRRADVYARAGTTLLVYGLRNPSWPYFETALSLDPQNAVAGYQLARRSIDAGKDMERAESLLRLNLERWPQEEGISWAHTHWRLGQLYEKQGRREQALREMEIAIRLRPDLKGVREDMNRLRGNAPAAR